MIEMISSKTIDRMSADAFQFDLNSSMQNGKYITGPFSLKFQVSLDHCDFGCGSRYGMTVEFQVRQTSGRSNSRRSISALDILCLVG